MKPPIKFGFIDIVLCVLLAAGLFVNIWAYLPRGEARAAPEASHGASPPPASSYETVAPEASQTFGGYLTELTPDILEGEWDADMILYSDGERALPYSIYELVFDIRHLSGDSYSVGVTTWDSRFADASVNPDVPPAGFAPALIEDEAFAEADGNGTLRFHFSFDAENVFAIPLAYGQNGVLTGTAYQTPETGLPEGGMHTVLTLTKRR